MLDQAYTCRLTFELELFLQRCQRSYGIAEKHGLEQTQEAVGQQVRFLGGEPLQPFAVNCPQTAPSVFVVFQQLVLLALAHAGRLTEGTITIRIDSFEWGTVSDFTRVLQ